MRPTVRKLAVEDIGDLQRLVAENIEGIETGLKVIDSRLLLGQTAIDLVGLDDRKALVLIALDFTPDESLLVRVMDAYSWCLEYPQTVQRLYPMARVSAEHPPRVLFIVERLTDLFARRIKALGIGAVDCVEFRHLEVNGTPALYIERVQRLRRSAPDSVPADHEPAASDRVCSTTPPAALPHAPAFATPDTASSASPITRAIQDVQPVVSESELGERPGSRAGADHQVSATGEMPAPNPVALLQQHLAELVASEAPEAPAAPEPSTPNGSAPEDSAITLESAEEAARRAAAALGAMTDRVRQNPEWQALMNSLGVEASVVDDVPTAAEAEAVPEPLDVSAPEAVTASETVAHTSAAPELVASAPSTPSSAAPEASESPIAEQKSPPAWAKAAEQNALPSGGDGARFFSQVTRSEISETPEPATALKAGEGPAAQASELDAMNFPKDGLSRQWIEFIHQLGGVK